MPSISRIRIIRLSGGVDAIQPDFILGVVLENSDSVTIGNFNNFAGNGLFNVSQGPNKVIGILDADIKRKGYVKQAAGNRQIR